MEVESRLRRSPEASITVIGPVRDKIPGLPDELRRTLEYRDCKRSIGTSVAMHRLRSQMPNYSPIRTDIVIDRRKQVDIAGRGRNTRQEMKDAFREHNKKKFSSRGEGVLLPTTALDCASGSTNMGCSHVAKKESASDAASALPGSVSGSTGSSGLTAISSGGGPVLVQSGGPAGSNGTSPGRSEETIRAVTSLNFKLPLSQAMGNIGTEASRDVRFYGWKSPCAQQ
jgi:hypothetical protein